MRFRFPAALAGALCALSALLTPQAQALPVATAPGCRVFPSSNPWNQRADGLPVHANSRRLIASIGADDGLHPDFGSGHWQGAPIGIPLVTVPRSQRRVGVRFHYADESDPGPYPLPRNAPIEGGADSDGDRHVIVIDRSRCRLYELFDAHRIKDSARWRAGSGATWDLGSNQLRPKGWTSADAAGLPILPGLVRYNEVKRGRIDHALRFTVARTRRAYVYPARHFASSDTSRDLPAMGQRLRLKAGFDIRGFPRQARIVLKALKRYGMIVADNGSDWFISGAPSRHWNNDALHKLGRVTGANFKVVDARSLHP